MSAGEVHRREQGASFPGWWVARSSNAESLGGD